LVGEKHNFTDRPSTLRHSEIIGNTISQTCLIAESNCAHPQGVGLQPAGIRPAITSAGMGYKGAVIIENGAGKSREGCNKQTATLTTAFRIDILHLRDTDTPILPQILEYFKVKDRFSQGLFAVYLTRLTSPSITGRFLAGYTTTNELSL